MGDKGKIINEQFSIPPQFGKSSYVSYVDEEDVYWRFVYITVPENNTTYQIGIASKKDNIEDFRFFLDSFKVKAF